MSNGKLNVDIFASSQARATQTIFKVYQSFGCSESGTTSRQPQNQMKQTFSAAAATSTNNYRFTKKFSVYTATSFIKENFSVAANKIK